MTILLAGLLPAQRRSAPDVRRSTAAELERLLGSSDPFDVAWAAYGIGSRQLHDAVPALRRALARHGEPARRPSLWDYSKDGPDFGWWHARLQLLDALILLDVRLPGEELRPHAVGWLRVPALILVAKSPRANADYLAARMAALDATPDDEWRHCGNLLAQQRDPRFVARCLEQYRFVIDITVRDRHPSAVGCGP